MLLIAMTLVSMAMVSYAGDSYVTPGDKSNPHTKEYLDVKPYLDKFELSVKIAKSCGDLEDATSAFYSDVEPISEIAYADNERVTDEEEKELNEQWERITVQITKLKSLWGCETDKGGSAVLEMPKEEVYEGPIFQIVEEMPSFPGGERKMMEYVAKNIVYPQEALETGIQGRVFVAFVIEPDGAVSNVRVIRSIGGGCDEEAIRVVKSMPKWNPGKQRGKTVRVSYQLPVLFKLQ